MRGLYERPGVSLRGLPLMTLVLVFRNRGVPDRPVLLPQVSSGGIEPFAVTLLSAAGGIQRVLPGPGPNASTAAIRSWYRDAWWALPEVERRSLVLAAGAGTTCLAPVLDGRADVVAIVRDPLDVVATTAAGGLNVPTPNRLRALGEGDASMAKRLQVFANRQARAVLTHRKEFDDLPITLGPPPDAARWRALLFDETLPGIRAVQANQIASEAQGLAERLRFRPKATEHVVRVAEQTPRITSVPFRPGHADLLLQLNWLDLELYERLEQSPGNSSDDPRGTV